MLAAHCGLAPAEWHACLTRARALSADPFDLALGEGRIREAAFLAGLAHLLGARTAAIPPPPAIGRAEEAFALRTYRTEDGARVVQPNGALALVLLRQHREGRLPPVILTGRQGFLDRIVEADGDRIARRALCTLPARHSARPPEARHGHASGRHGRGEAARVMLALAGLGVLSGLAVLFPVEALVLPPLLLSPIFVIAGLAALTATFESLMPAPPPPPVESRNLPRYSVLVPLYREANIVADLVARLDALQYPRDRLEILFLVESDDAETRAALAAVPRPPGFLIFPVPEGTPRTKPRALNAALPFATGDLVVVYDAEDAPEPDQLLRAAALFGALPAQVACLQARLAIANPRDGFLTRRFAIDYAALFDCMKAGSASAGWSVPLGGSSNHFRLPVLRQIGAWDAWNVTEDAELGLRLARFGWSVGDLRSTTWEEAPNRLDSWLGQRRRWLKGWLQTLVVQLRDPRGLIAGLGPFRTMVIAATGFAVLAGALLAPVFALAVALRLANGTPLGSGGPLLILADAMLVLTLLVTLAVEIIPAFVALARRRALFLAPWILLAPVTHLLVSLAAWQALRELARRPYHWQKTAHGQARRTGGLHAIIPGSNPPHARTGGALRPSG
ncbi:glycosyltransferase [Rhabdaerophilum calidifontis]|uniref:glycosyltransferase n=1 Tax=Rhabdaerophilum calidifontis TaxID=2604328 RepID=UPI00140BA084|nr:glycosyltransferase [Rhabdaerophilum calidifontis]